MDFTERNPLLDGAKIKLGDRDCIVPPLNLRAIKALQSQIERLGDPAVSANEKRDISMAVILAAIQRNYPKLTADDLDEIVDLASMPKLIDAAMGGFVRQQSGNVQNP